jgi:ubiquinone/menaquinone biosynthesis C-methylase UbiE
MNDQQVTRGFGLLEKYLAKKRACMANRLIPPHLREGRILDIGCGSVPYFLLNTEFSYKFGIDKVAYGESQCAFCEEHGIHFTDFDFEKESALPFDDQYFNAVTMLAVVEHIEPTRLPTMIAEVLRALKTDGVPLKSMSTRLLTGARLLAQFLQR